MLHAGYADSVTNDGPRFHSDISDKELPEPVTRTIKVTLPNLFYLFYSLVHDHSFIHFHACIHTFIHTFITYIQAVHMQMLHHNASCCVTKR